MKDETRPDQQYGQANFSCSSVASHWSQWEHADSRESMRALSANSAKCYLLQSPCVCYSQDNLPLAFVWAHILAWSPSTLFGFSLWNWIRFRLGIKRESDRDSPALRGNFALHLKQAFVWLLNKNNIGVWHRRGTAQIKTIGIRVKSTLS